MCGLQMGKPRQEMDVEGRQRPCHHAAPPGSGPPRHDQPSRESRRRKAQDEQQVECQHRRSAKPPDRRADQSGHHERFRVRERVRIRLEDVARKQPRGIVWQRVRDPAEDPRVEFSVRVVVERMTMRSRCDGPGVHHREQQCERKRGQCAGTVHGRPTIIAA